MKKKTLTSTKMTFELTNEAKDTLEKLKSNLNIPFAKIINTIISTFCNCDEDIKNELIEMLRIKIKTLLRTLDETDGEFEIKKLTDKITKYQQIESLINDGKITKIENLKAQVDMKMIVLKSGYIIFPANWIVLNMNDAEKSNFACVVEVSRVDFKVPHFLYFTNLKPTAYDDDFYATVNELCTQHYPKFKSILEDQVELISDPYNPGRYINQEEWLKAPIIGHYNIFIKGTPTVHPDYKPPFGAMIIPTKKGVYDELF